MGRPPDRVAITLGSPWENHFPSLLAANPLDMQVRCSSRSNQWHTLPIIAIVDHDLDARREQPHLPNIENGRYDDSETR